MALQPFAPEAAGGGEATLQPYDPVEVAAGSTKITAPTAGAGVAIPAPTLSGNRVNVKAPNGQTYSIDEAELPKVVAQGWRPETAAERDVREYVDENKGLSGTAKVFFRGLADEAAFGVLDPILDHNADPLERAKWEGLKKENTAANIVGRGLGFGASLLYGGEFAKGAEVAGHVAERAVLGGAERAASSETYRALAGAVESRMMSAGVPAAEAAAAAPGFARKLTANAAKYGAESVAFVAPKAATEAALGDPEQAGETIVSALGAGALLGLAGGVAGAGFKQLLAGAEKGLPKGSVGGWVEETANNQAFRSLANNQASLGKILKDAEGIYGTGAANEIGAFVRKEGLLKNFREGAEEYADRIGKRREEVAGEIGKAYRDITAKAGDAGRVGVDELVAEMSDRVLKPLSEGEAAIGSEALRDKVSGFLESFASNAAKLGRKDGTLTLEEAHKLRATIDKKIDWKHALTSDDYKWNEALADVRRAMESKILTRAEEVAAAGGESFRTQIKALNRRFGMISSIEKGVEDYAYREAKNRVMSPTDYGAGFAGSALGALSHGNIGGLITGPLMALGHHIARTEGNALAAKALGAAADGGGLLLAEQAAKRVAERLDTLPKALSSMASPAARGTLGTNVLSRFVDADPSFRKSDKATQVTILADRLSSLASQPAEMQKHIEELVGPYSADAPTVATQAGAKVAAMVNHLAAVAPKAPSVPSPFAPKQQWKPSPKQVSEFEQRVNIAVDPMSAIDRLRAHAITPGEVDTLRTLYPKLYERMVAKVAEATAEGKAPALPYASRVVLGRFLGSTVDRSMSPARVASYQQAFAQPEAKPHGGAPMKVPSLETDAERIAAR